MSFKEATTAPLAELEIYRDIVRQQCAQLSILKQYDADFIFLETNYLQHLAQVDMIINAKRTYDNENPAIQSAIN